MKTWTYNKQGVYAVVSSDCIELAIKQLLSVGIKAKPEDLVPLPVNHRYVRRLDKKEES